MTRVISNYVRMLVTFAMGMLIIRIFLGIGEGVYAVIALLGASIGVSGMLKEMIRGSMIPELGLAFHSGDKKRFRETYASSFILSSIAAFFAVGVLMLFYVFLDKFKIDAGLAGAAGIYLLTRMGYTFITIILAPITNLLPINNRMVAMNVWLALERAVEVAAAAVIYYFYAELGPANQLVAFGYVSAIAMSLVVFAWVAHVFLIDRIFWPRPRLASLQKAQKIGTTIFWNAFVVLAMNLYIPFNTFIMNVLFGVQGTVIFGLAAQLLAYLRQSSMGLVLGMDAVVARLSAGTKASDRKKVDELVTITSFLQAMTIFGFGLLLLLNARLLFSLWVEDRLTDPATQLPKVLMLFQILIFGVIVRALSEGWMYLLSGAGQVKKYGPVLFATAIFNPLLIPLFLWLLPDKVEYTAPAISTSLLMVLVHIVFLPIVTARHLETTALALIKPFVLPALFTLLSTGLSLAATRIFELTPWMNLYVSTAIFGIVFAAGLFVTWRANRSKLAVLAG